MVVLCVGANPCVRPTVLSYPTVFIKETNGVLSGRTHGCAPTVSRKYCAINSNSHITANAFSDAALQKRYLTISLSKAAESAHRRPLPRWAVRESNVRIIDYRHRRVINSNSHITANAFSDAALMIRYLTILLFIAAESAHRRIAAFKKGMATTVLHNAL